ncbi:MAG: hypothetical protein QXU67_05190 [Candidatus Bathyarchaeia archaeon]
MATPIMLEDEEGVIKGPHYYLIEKRSLGRLEKEVLALLKKEESMPLSAIWRKFNCHLWEIVTVLKRLKEKGLIEEADVTSKAYQR